jgi:hypothetical protein
MDKNRKTSDAIDPYAVGYGRPPEATRFQPGKSGNPRGRPKGMKSVGKLIADAMARRVTVQENGGPRKMRMQDVIVQGLVNDAARREPRALRLLFSLIDRYGDGRDNEIDATTLLPDDEAIIMSFVAAAQGHDMHSAPAPRSADTKNAQEAPGTSPSSDETDSNGEHG